MDRICIYNKDVQIITGKGERQCRKIIKFIKQSKNKEKHQPVTIYELCEYLGIDPDTVRSLLG